MSKSDVAGTQTSNSGATRGRVAGHGARGNEDLYYTLQVDRLELGNPGKWGLLIVQCSSRDGSVSTKRMHLERLFDTHEEADEYGCMWVSTQQALVIHPAAIDQLRLTFGWYGFDVSAYSNDQIGKALDAQSSARTQSCGDLFAGAFQRLRGAGL